MRNLPQRLATVTSSAYLPGTRVMLDSFLHYNKWFDGVVIVIHDDLSETEQNALLADFGNVQFRHPSLYLANAIDRLTEAEPRLKSRAARFFSLECFWTDEPGDLLFCDGDVLFTADISAAFAISGDMLACPDRSQSVGNMRDGRTMAEVDRQDASHASFNAGMMCLRRSLRSEKNRDRILGQMTPQSWRTIQSDHTDQAVLNILFGGEVVLLPERYNYLVGHAAALRDFIAGGISDAAVLHFNGAAKPWRLEHHRAAARYDATFIRACEHWFAAQIRYLKRCHFAPRQ